MQKGWFFFSHGAFSQRLVKTSVDNLKRVYQAAGFSSVTVSLRSSGMAATLRLLSG